MFWLELKAVIDYIKPGYGSSTTDPNVQRALNDPSKCAQILNLDVKFVEAMFSICRLLGSKRKPENNSWRDTVKFIYKFYYENYNKYCSLTPSLQKNSCIWLEND